MKSATLKFAFVFLCMFSLFGCEHSIDKEEVLPNNPVIPYTFSIIGKKYVCEGATQEYAYVADILYFFSADSMVYYSTASKDFALDKALHTDYGIYKLKVNNLQLKNAQRAITKDYISGQMPTEQPTKETEDIL